MKGTKQVWNVSAVLLTAGLLAAVLSSCAIASAVDDTAILENVVKVQVPFIENRGQVEYEAVKFYANTFGGTVFIMNGGEIVYSLPKVEEKKAVKGLTLKEKFVGGRVDVIKGEGKALTRVGYFKGNDPSKWKSNIPTYELVSLGEIYKGIELKLKACGNTVEKLFYVGPTANPEDIKVKIEGANSLKVNEDGELEVGTGLGAVKFTKPVAYQEENDKRKYVEVAYAVKGNEYSFKVRDYDRSKELVIDPLLASTFLGGSGSYFVLGEDVAYSITTDSNGNVYVAGSTTSVDFPTTSGTFDGIYNYNGDVFVSKFDSNLQNLLASTFLGGEVGWDGEDIAYDISLDGNGNVYVVGETGSSDFPTTSGAYQTTFNGLTDDAFVSKLDDNLQNLLASTFLGGSAGFTGRDTARSIAIDSDGNVYVAGETKASDFPTTFGAYQTTFNGGCCDAFVSKFDGDLQNLLASTFLGGDEEDYANSISLCSNGNVYVTGETYSPDFPTTPNAYDPTFNGHTTPQVIYSDVFISKLDSNLQNLSASTFLGENLSESAHSITIHSSGNVYVSGWTVSSDFPTTPIAYDTTYNDDDPGQTVLGDVFVSKFNGNLQNLLASTFLGGSSQESANSIFIESNGNVYVVGYTKSAGFPTTPGAHDTSWGSNTGFVSKFDGNLHNLLTSTFLGGDVSIKDVVNSLSIDTNGNVYVAGYTQSSDFPTTPGAYDTIYNLYGDAFVSKFGSDSQKGDLNGDGNITTADAAIALQLTVSGEWNADADISGDGRITSLDALMILQAAAGAISL